MRSQAARCSPPYAPLLAAAEGVGPLLPALCAGERWAKLLSPSELAAAACRLEAALSAPSAAAALTRAASSGGGGGAGGAPPLGRGALLTCCTGLARAVKTAAGQLPAEAWGAGVGGGGEEGGAASGSGGATEGGAASGSSSASIASLHATLGALRTALALPPVLSFLGGARSRGVVVAMEEMAVSAAVLRCGGPDAYAAQEAAAVYAEAAALGSAAIAAWRPRPLPDAIAHACASTPNPHALAALTQDALRYYVGRRPTPERIAQQAAVLRELNRVVAGVVARLVRWPAAAAAPPAAVWAFGSCSSGFGEGGSDVDAVVILSPAAVAAGALPTPVFHALRRQFCFSGPRGGPPQGWSRAVAIAHAHVPIL